MQEIKDEKRTQTRDSGRLERKNGGHDRKKRRSRTVKRLFSVALAVFLISVTLLSLLITVGAIYVRRHPEDFTVDPALLSTVPRTGPTTIYSLSGGASDGAVDTESAIPYETLAGTKKSTFVPVTEIAKDLRNAFVAIEDKRFYRHRGVDLYRTGAAVLNFLLKRDKSFGGSTITQQLVKNLTGESDKTAARKVREVFRALDLEKQLTKEEILEYYLNVIGLANGCVGVGSASEYYFGISPEELSLAQCAAIAAITKHPARYDPTRHPEENEKRRNVILSEMREQGYITDAEYRAALDEEITLSEAHAEDGSENADVSSWYADLVVEDVIVSLVRERGYTRDAAARLVYRGGLRIYTPVVPALQETLADYYRDESNFPRLENGARPASAMLVLDKETGNILAVAGAIGKKTGDRVLNYATGAKRPPGSVLKPLSVYAPALEYGVAGYATVFDDVPVRFTKDENGRFTAWPHNASSVYRGLTSVSYAVSHSLNTVAVRVVEEVGVDRAFNFLRDRLGVTSLVENESGRTDRGLAALALGQMNYGASLREITAAYTALANRGVYRNARSFLLVTDSLGRVLLDNPPDARAALAEENAELMTKMLENVTESGTAKSLTLTDTVAVAGKTGTTQYSLDKWFVGYTPSLLAGVWFGSDETDALAQLGTNPAVETFDAVFERFYEKNADAFDSSARHFSYPNLCAVRVCADSGLLTSDACTLDPRGDRSTVAYFTEGTIPRTFCTCHVAVPYCGAGDGTGDGVVTPLSPVAPTRTVGLLRVSRSFPTEVAVTDAQYTAAPVGTVLLPSVDVRASYYSPSLQKGVYVGSSYAPYPFNRPAVGRREEEAAD